MGEGRGAPELRADEPLGKIIRLADLRNVVLGGDGAQCADGFGCGRHSSLPSSARWPRAPADLVLVLDNPRHEHALCGGERWALYSVRLNLLLVVKEAAATAQLR